MTKTEIAGRLSELRREMERERLGACIFLSGDPHQSEYPADHWKGREWISGFDGSAGTAVVTMHKAALWTDSRYFIAAEEQLEDTGYILMKEGLAGTPTIAEWLEEQLVESMPLGGKKGCYTEVAVDGMVCAEQTARELITDLRRHGGMTLRTNIDLLSRIWSRRPALPKQPVVEQPLSLTGEDRASKLSRIRQALRREHHADGMLMARLDDIAWTLNLRGADVHCNPVFLAYLLIDSRKATLYIDQAKLSPDIKEQLSQSNVAIDDYSRVTEGLKAYFEQTILMDPDEVSHTLYNICARARIDAPSPVPMMKAVKTEQEQEGFREAMLRDGIAMTRFLMWLPKAVATGEATELSVSRHLEELRRRQEGFVSLSFETISAYRHHAAIVHYEPTPASDIKLQQEGLLLIDSGAQYRYGTTDITRTIALGPLSDEEKRVYTLVLKGHLRLQNLIFPKGANGTQLDAIARAPLWAAGLNYRHGTGHGVGAFLNVHEGPQQIRMEHRPAPMLAGMTITDEPGIYLKGRFGVRIENTLLTRHHYEGEEGEFLSFEPLTLCPIDTKPIVLELMTQEELRWLNDYHALVRERLSPHLSPDEQQWLEEATKEL